MTKNMEENKKMTHTELVAQDWNNGSDSYYSKIYTAGVIERIIADPMWAFPYEVRQMLRAACPDLQGKHVLVPSSGDCGAVFAFHLLGARVTSADIAARQLENAQRIAWAQGWDIEFVHDDSMRLARIPDAAYDLVYTSNGVHVWIDDLPAMYGSFARVLKPGGSYVMFETHPFARPFDSNAQEAGEFRVIKPYESTGPSGEVPTYAWRIMDLMNAMMDAGFIMRRMEEFHAHKATFDCWWYASLEEGEADGWRKHDWQCNPWAALPQWIGMWARKENHEHHQNP